MMGHDRGAKVVARGLRDAGFDVVYTGLHQTPEMIARAALDEDVDAVGISIVSGAHMTLMPRIANLLHCLHCQGQGDIIISGGGVIPDEDILALREAGIERIFTPGAAIADIMAWLEERVRVMK